MNQTFSEKLVEYLRLRDMDMRAEDFRSVATRAADAQRMAQLEREMDQMIDGMWEAHKAVEER